MADFSMKQGNVSAGTEACACEGDKPTTGFDDGPKGDQVPKGPGSGINSNGKRIR